ncbi:MAG: nucleotide exchange factor GrpE [Firmicutes bacterium]|nr:nucleotide exchange factor GrpE [Bacillota bacterium]
MEEKPNLQDEIPVEIVPEEIVEEELEEPVFEEPEEEPDPQEDALLKEAKRAEEAESKVKDLQDRLLRNMAEFDNYRKRTTREKAQSFDNGVKHVAETLLPVIDNLERALSAAQDPEDSFVKGVQMTHDQLLAMLEKSGIRQIDPLGETFDPHFHEAMQHVDDETHGESEVVQVFQKGYVMGESLIRAALVKVAN